MLRRGGATSGHWSRGWDPPWLQKYRLASRDLNVVLALATRLLSLVLWLMSSDVSVCDSGKQCNHRKQRSRREAPGQD